MNDQLSSEPVRRLVANQLEFERLCKVYNTLSETDRQTPDGKLLYQTIKVLNEELLTLIL